MESKTSVKPKYINLKYAFPKRLVSTYTVQDSAKLDVSILNNFA